MERPTSESRRVEASLSVALASGFASAEGHYVAIPHKKALYLRAQC
jgi:hypothetical protein